MRGHTFVWHSQSGYASSVTNKATLIADMENHIDKVGTHFKDKVFEWDVLNEITADGSGGLRNSFWRSVGGDDFPDKALTKARAVLGASAYLYYNDYGGDGVNTKSTSMFNLVKKWQAAGVPIDGIGLQCHLSSPVNKQSISDNIKRFGEIGIRISLTEIDIKNGTSQDWTNLLNACLENANCMTFMAWGLADGNSWLGSNCNCLLYSGSANSPTAKPHVQALIDALKLANATVVTNRKAWAARPPGGGGTRVIQIAAPKAGKTSAALFGAAAAPVFTTGNGALVDVQGRSRLPVLNAGPDGLRLEAR
jgi:endo-1,4-beta-xylanase